MSLEVEIPDNEVTYLNDAAKKELTKILQEHTKRLLLEAGRLEANIRTTQGNPEITSSMIKDASTVINRHYVKPRKSYWFLAARIASLVAAVLVGLSSDNLSEFWGQNLFVVAFSIATILTTIEYLKE